METGLDKYGRLGIVTAFFNVGVLFGAVLGLIELPIRYQLTKTGIVGPGVDLALKIIMFAGFYAILFGSLGIMGGLSFSVIRPLFKNRAPQTLAIYMFLAQAALMYVSVPVNKMLPAISHPVSISANIAMIMAGGTTAFFLFLVSGRRLSGIIPEWFSHGKTVIFAFVICVLGGGAATIAGNFKVKYESLETGGRNIPNYLLISVDTLRADHLPVYGYPHTKTPAIDSLAAKGTVWEKAYSTSSWTLPAMGSIATGRAPRELGLQKTSDMIPEKAVTLAEAMKSKGLATVAISSNPFFSVDYGFGQGFDRFINVYDREQRHGLSGLYLFDHLYRLRKSLDDAANVNRLAFSQLDELKGRPYFLWIHYMDPHKPYGGPWPLDIPDYGKNYTGSISFVYGWANPVNENREPLSEQDMLRVKALYDADIVRFDTHLGMLLAKMESMGLLENTYIILVGDHGEEFLEHGDFEHGKNLHKEQTHVPMIMVSPNEQNRRRVEYPVSISGLGNHLVTKLEAPDGELGGLYIHLYPTERNVAYAEMQSHGRHRYSLRFRDSEKGGWLYLFDAKSGDKRLFNLDIDPDENHDVIGNHPELAAEFERWLQLYISDNDQRAGKIKSSKKADISPEKIEALKNLGYIVQ